MQQDDPGEDGAAASHSVVMAVLLRGDEVLLAHRHPSRRWYPDCWDLIGGHIEAGESPEQALRRECSEELGIDVIAAEPYALGAGDPEVNARAFLVTEWTGEIANRAPEEHDALGWFTSSELQHLHLADTGYVTLLAQLIEVG